MKKEDGEKTNNQRIWLRFLVRILPNKFDLTHSDTRTLFEAGRTGFIAAAFMLAVFLFKLAYSAVGGEISEMEMVKMYAISFCQTVGNIVLFAIVPIYFVWFLFKVPIASTDLTWWAANLPPKIRSSRISMIVYSLANLLIAIVCLYMPQGLFEVAISTIKPQESLLAIVIAILISPIYMAAFFVLPIITVLSMATILRYLLAKENKFRRKLGIIHELQYKF